MMSHHEKVVQHMEGLSYFEISEQYEAIVAPLERAVLLFQTFVVANRTNRDHGTDLTSSGVCRGAHTHIHNVHAQPLCTHSHMLLYVK